MPLFCDRPNVQEIPEFLQSIFPALLDSLALRLFTCANCQVMQFASFDHIAFLLIENTSRFSDVGHGKSAVRTNKKRLFYPILLRDVDELDIAA